MRSSGQYGDPRIAPRAPQRCAALVPAALKGDSPNTVDAGFWTVSTPPARTISGSKKPAHARSGRMQEALRLV